MNSSAIYDAIFELQKSEFLLDSLRRQMGLSEGGIYPRGGCPGNRCPGRAGGAMSEHQ